ncbi:MAG: FHA domain-containing protein, partial [Minicystis sp.]
MLCQQCGAPLGVATRFCEVCAFPIGPPPPMPPPPSPPPVAARPAPPPERARPQQPLAGFLVSFQDDPMGTVWLLRRGRNTIGRADTGREVDIAVPSGRVGSFQAIIDCDEHRFLLSDAQSPSGTFLNEDSIGYGCQREVRDGDMVGLGGYTVMVIS